jgi:glycosyltransferase involved in cell wall biosynthesis
MKILLIADGRSPTTRRWVQAAAGLGHEIVLVSTFPCAPVPGTSGDVTLPVAFAALGGSAAGAGAARTRASTKPSGGLMGRLRPLMLAARYLLGPLTLRYYAPRLRKLAEQMQPDLAHALRIPYEGMLAAHLPPGLPLAVSIWGNDLTLHARASRQMAALTRAALARADGLLADAARDVRLARALGMDARKPALVVPGSAGMRLDEIAAACAGQPEDGPVAGVEIPPGPLVVNPRGFRTGSVRTDTFFAAIPLVLGRRPDVVFASAAMAGQSEALRWMDQLNLHGKVTLLPHLSQPDLWRLLHRAQVTLSVSQHDGTPNSLLEAMAVGAFPIAGDIESLREWITPGVNGLLVEPGSPHSLAEAILTALQSPQLRSQAAEINARLVAERAEAGAVGQKIDAFYRQLAGSAG